MKHHTLSFSVIVLSLLASVMSCNDSVFVEALDVSASELQMDGEGDSSVVVLNKSPQWGIVSVDQPDNPDSSQFYGKVCNENGKTLYNRISFYKNSFKDKVQLIYQGTFNGFIVKRSGDQQIEIAVDENLTDKDFKFTVWVADYHKNIPIHITQTPSAGYDFDHISYSLTPSSSYKNREESYPTLVVNNSGTEPIEWKLSIFSNVKEISMFASQNPKAFAYLKSNEQVAIPDSAINDELQFSNKKINYQSGEQKRPLSFDNVIRNVVIQPGKTEIDCIIEYEYFDADYTLHIRNRKTGKLKSVTGIYHSKRPTGEYHIALKRLSQP